MTQIHDFTFTDEYARPVPGQPRGKILVVDDDREVRLKIESILRKENFEPILAADGFQAIKIAETTPVDLVLLDIVMDKMDGFKVCQFLKNKKEFESPIIFISTRTNLQDVLLGFRIGADDYIYKPFVPEELIARIEVGLRLKSYQDRLRSRQKELEKSNEDLESSKIALEKKLIELRTMFETFSLIHSSLNPQEIARAAILSIIGHKGIEFALVLCRDHEKRNFLVPLFYQGLDNFTPTDFWFSYDGHFVTWLEKLGKPTLFSTVPDEMRKLPIMQLLVSYSPELIFPLLSENQLHAVLFLGPKVTGKSFSQDDMEFLEMMCLELSSALKKAEFYLDLKSKSEELAAIYVDTLRVLANAIEARDKYTIGHTWRVCRFAQALAKALNWEEQKIEQIEIGGLLHDIGKIGVDNRILSKPEPLTEDEYSKMKDHPELGAKILADIDFLKPYLPYILFHQERFDGSGYPMQLKGKEIPPEGRLLAIADAFDAMTSDRPYRTGFAPERAINEIERLAGKQFDPEMAVAFTKIYHEGKLSPYLQKKEKMKTKLSCPICQSSLNLKDLLFRGSDYICPICRHVIEVTIQPVQQ